MGGRSWVPGKTGFGPKLAECDLSSQVDIETYGLWALLWGPSGLPGCILRLVARS